MSLMVSASVNVLWTLSSVGVVGWCVKEALTLCSQLGFKRVRPRRNLTTMTTPSISTRVKTISIFSITSQQVSPTTKPPSQLGSVANSSFIVANSLRGRLLFPRDGFRNLENTERELRFQTHWMLWSFTRDRTSRL
ncbi:hypothetical protein T439DRAFT_334731 [Meredithblackwellia eburnea MCA 4105]